MGGLAANGLVSHPDVRWEASLVERMTTQEADDDNVVSADICQCQQRRSSQNELRVNVNQM